MFARPCSLGHLVCFGVSFTLCTVPSQVPLTATLGPHTVSAVQPDLHLALQHLYHCRSAVTAPMCEDQQTVALALVALATERRAARPQAGSLEAIWQQYVQHFPPAKCYNGLLVTQNMAAAVPPLVRKVLQPHVTIYDQLYHSLFTAPAHADREPTTSALPTAKCPTCATRLRQLLGPVSRRQFLKAVCWVEARAFAMPAAQLEELHSSPYLHGVLKGTSGAGMVMLIVPGADILNHHQLERHFPLAHMHYNPARDALQLRALRSYNATQEVYSDYGLKGNVQLLVLPSLSTSPVLSLSPVTLVGPWIHDQAVRWRVLPKKCQLPLPGLRVVGFWRNKPSPKAKKKMHTMGFFE